MKKNLKIQTFTQGLSGQPQKQSYRQYRLLYKKKSQHLNQKAQKDKRMEKYIPGKSNSAKKQLVCLTSFPHSVALLFITQPTIPR